MMRFQVTAEDIRLGKPRLHWQCPVARAIIRGLGFVDGYAVGVTGRGIRIGKTQLVEAPKCVADFVHRFDTEQSVQPFEFDLTGPWDVVPVEEPEAELVGT